jgi:tetratricopeptide (TPR) repeat protein
MPFLEGTPVPVRRERGQGISADEAGLRVWPEAYELRWMAALAKAARVEAAAKLKEGTVRGHEEALRLLEALRERDAACRGDRKLALDLLRARLRLGRPPGEPDLLEAVLGSDPSPGIRAEAEVLAGERFRSQGRAAEAEARFRAALAIPLEDEALARELRQRAASPEAPLR